MLGRDAVAQQPWRRTLGVEVRYRLKASQRSPILPEGVGSPDLPVAGPRWSAMKRISARPGRKRRGCPVHQYQPDSVGG